MPGQPKSTTGRLLNAAGKPAGVLYAILPCRDVVASTIEGVRIGKTGYAYIVDNGGLMLAHPDAKLIQEFDAKKVEWGKIVLPDEYSYLVLPE